MTTRLEYVGFTVSDSAREYSLRVRQEAAEPLAFTLSIPIRAFLDHRVRYQDGPEVCFLKLQRELAACASGLPPTCLGVTDADLEDYRLAHTARAPQRRPRPPAPTEPLAFGPSRFGR